MRKLFSDFFFLSWLTRQSTLYDNIDPKFNLNVRSAQRRANKAIKSPLSTYCIFYFKLPVESHYKLASEAHQLGAVSEERRKTLLSSIAQLNAEMEKLRWSKCLWFSFYDSKCVISMQTSHRSTHLWAMSWRWIECSFKDQFVTKSKYK